MANLMRFDPFRELQSLHNAMDQLFETSFPRTRTSWSRAWNVELDVIENDDAFLVKADIPGINPDDLEIVYSNGVLTIQGEVKEDQEVEEGQYHLRERRYGSFRRSLTLPTPIAEGEIQASYDDGTLALWLPKAEEAKPKRIPVKTNGNMVIEG